MVRAVDFQIRRQDAAPLTGAIHERHQVFHVELTRTPQALEGKLLAVLLPLVGPSSLRKSLAGPLQAA
ncbi:hypothetical protein IU459_28770 [Nocardia amamiensis]|uniref:Uncharacterized protein n=1 Tax=Nocardia amamiensis TaxID=404578 RepID=A0ABS0CY24_9NOCA|nr:hypothetical protein [Nocardia amamiensis]MBF6301501.1 hypothetical protein [Nocardia amamiensis]